MKRRPPNQKFHAPVRSKSRLHALIAVAFVFLMGFGIYQAVQSSLFNLTQLEIEPLSEGYPLTRDEIARLAKIPVGHSNLFQLNLEPYEARLMKHPWVKGVVLGKQFPGTLSLKVIERIPVALLTEDHGKILYLESDGTTFQSESMVYPRALPIYSGFSAENPQILKKVNEFVSTWFAADKVPGLKLSSVSYDEKLGLRAIIAYPLKNKKQMRTVLELGLNIEEATLIPQQRLIQVLDYLGGRSMQASKVWLGDGKKIVVKMARGT